MRHSPHFHSTEQFHHYSQPCAGPDGDLQPGRSFRSDFGFGGPPWGPHGFGGRSHRANRGDTRLAILSLLRESEANGYGLMKAIAARTDDAWRPSPGSIYPTLQQLVDEELVGAEGKGRHVQYSLTEAGRDFAQEHAEQLDQVWQTVPGRTPEEAAFHASFLKLLGVVRQFRFETSPEQRAAAQAEIDRARKALYLILADDEHPDGSAAADR